MRREEAFQWGLFSASFTKELASWMGTRSVLEIFAGNGYHASLLKAEGIDILPTTIFSTHDGHHHGMHCEVMEMNAYQAVAEFGANYDILMMSWPVASTHALESAKLWGTRKPIIFIGEVTDHSLGLMGLGGCASDEFFEQTREEFVFNSYKGRSMLDRAAVRYLLPKS